MKDAETPGEYRYHPGTHEAIADRVRDRHPSTVQIARHFAWAHLPDHLRDVSSQVCLLAMTMLAELPDGPELSAGLRKLLEAKDCFVRAALDQG